MIESPVNPNRETVIVTGSSGLIGYKLCERLAGSYNVVGLDRPGAPHPPRIVDCIDFDVTSDESVRRAFQEVRERHAGKIASVVHLAAYYDFSGKASPLYEKITVQGTARLLNALRAFKVEQFVFSSTMLVHAPCNRGERINEQSSLQPKWDYPKSKVKTENLIRRERGKMPVVFARIAGIYDNHCHSIPLAHQIQRIYERQLTGHLFPGDLSNGQAFLHLDDIVTFLFLTVAKRHNLPQELALLAGEPITLGYGTLQREFAKYIHGTDWETLRIPKWLAKIGAWTQDHIPLMGDPFIKPWMIDRADDHYEMDITRAQKLLGWQPRRLLYETLPLMIAALKKDPASWYKENKLRPSARVKNTDKGNPPSPDDGMAVRTEEAALPVQHRLQDLVGTASEYRGS